MLLTASTSSGDCVQFVSDADGAVRLSLELEGETAESMHLSVNNAHWVAEAEVDVLALSPVTELSMGLREATPAALSPGVSLGAVRAAAAFAPLVTAASLLAPIIASYAAFTPDTMPVHVPHITVSSKDDLEEGIRQAMVRNRPIGLSTATSAACGSYT